MPGGGAVATGRLGTALAVITGSRLDTLPALAELVTELMIGIGPIVGIGSMGGSVIGVVAGAEVVIRAGVGAGRDGWLLLAGAVRVTVSEATAAVVMAGLVAALAATVNVTDEPLEGVSICASRVNCDGVTAVLSGPSCQEAVPSPLGHRPAKTACPLEAVSVTDTLGTDPFCAWT